jgi:hypothetical protein
MVPLTAPSGTGLAGIETRDMQEPVREKVPEIKAADETKTAGANS